MSKKYADWKAAMKFEPETTAIISQLSELEVQIK